MLFDPENQNSKGGKVGYGIKILIKGPRACFTRPELKAERVSYDVITPSAARGIIEAVYWKPAIQWFIDRIVVLNEIRFETIRRNEVGSKLSYQNAKKAAKAEPRKERFSFLNASADRQQRATMLLKNVAYVVEAHFEMTGRAGNDDSPEKHISIVRRRLEKGQCFNQPCLGCREFPAEVELLNEDEPTSFYVGEAEKDLGFMLYDMDFSDLNKPKPGFFRAVMRNGVIDIASAREELRS